MNNVIVGTAGHVDHGKTCLIKALTGIDTDRLKEEKKRGITIELGFAEMPNDCGINIGIIDVPGHEKFVRNMLAGIGGIDLVLMVIASDEGVMPQTVEHFEIIKMLNIKKGIIVLTKIDMVDGEWIEIVKEDVINMVRGTFLEGASIMEVSSYTGQNIPELKKLICDMVSDCGQRRFMPELLRIPVDRVFTIDGFGTVITGTLIEGSVSVGDEVEIYPEGQIAKVRNLQVHGNMVEKAYAGQRTAVNLSNIKKEDIRKGNVIAAKDTLTKTMMVDVKIDMFKDSPRTLINGSRVHLYFGAAEAICKTILLDSDALESGQAGYAQLRLEEEIAVKKGDRFIIRFYSPLETIGGGIMLDANPPKRKRFSEEVIKALRIKEMDSGAGLLEQSISEGSITFMPLEKLANKIGWTLSQAKENAEILKNEGKIFEILEGIFIHSAYIEKSMSKLEKLLEDYHRKNPISPGMNKEEFRSKIEASLHLATKEAVALMNFLVRQKYLRAVGNNIALKNFEVVLNEGHNALQEKIEKLYKEAGFEMPVIEDVIANEKDKKLAKQMIEQLEASGNLVKVQYPYYMHKDKFNQAISTITQHINKNGQITLAEFRDLVGTSRKYAVLILEGLDQKKITKMQGDSRVLY